MNDECLAAEALPQCEGGMNGGVSLNFSRLYFKSPLGDLGVHLFGVV